MDLYQLAMAPVLLPRKVETPIALSAEGSSTFSPSGLALVALGRVAAKLVRAVIVIADASLRVESEEATAEKVDGRFVAPEEVSFSATLAVSVSSAVTVACVFAADADPLTGPFIGVEKIK